MEILDNSWINNYETLEKDYFFFYKEQVDNINLYFIYINNNNEINLITQENVSISKKLEKKFIYKIIKKKKYNNGINYKLISLLKYNILLEPENIKNFLNNEFNENNNIFLIPIYKIEDIEFEDTITLFKDLNSLFFVFFDNSNSNIIYNHKLNKKILTKKYRNISNYNHTQKKN